MSKIKDHVTYEKFQTCGFYNIKKNKFSVNAVFLSVTELLKFAA